MRIVGVHMVPDGYVPPDWPPLPLLESVERKRRLRDEETDEVLRIVSSSPEPVVVGGDFNGHAFGPRYRRLAAAMTDAYRATAFGFGYTLTSSLPTKRVDYLWTRGLRPLRTWVPPTKASDHLPVVGEFALPSG